MEFIEVVVAISPALGTRKTVPEMNCDENKTKLAFGTGENTKVTIEPMNYGAHYEEWLLLVWMCE